MKKVLNLDFIFQKTSLLGFLFVFSFMLLAVDGKAQSLPGAEQPEQVAIELSDPESKAAVRELVSTLSDDSVRQLLIQRLDAVAESKQKAGQEDVGVFTVLSQGFALYWRNAKDAIQNVSGIPDVVGKIGTSLGKVIDAEGAGRLFMVFAIALVLGIAAERAVTSIFSKRKQALIDSFSTKLSGILKILYTRLSYDILSVLAFLIVSFVVIRNFYAAESMALQLVYIPLAGIVGTWFAYVLSRFFFAPKRPDLRICKTSDERAQRLTISFSILAGYFVLMHNTFYLFVQIGFSDYGGYEYMQHLGYFMNITLYVAAAAVIWYNREGLTEVLVENKKRVFMAIGEEEPLEQSWFAQHWPKIAMGLILIKYLMVEIVVNTVDVGVYSTGAVYITFIVIFLWPGVDANVSLLVAKGIVPPEDETVAAGKARRSMQQGLLRVGRILIVGLVLYVLARLWGLNVLDLAEAGLGAQAAANLVELLFVVIVGYLAWELVSIFIGRWLAKEGGNPDDEEEGAGEIGGVGLSRVATLLPIIRRTAQFLIVVVSTIMVLDNWGVNVGPILAGAGVVGLAIGFGAQTLVKDIVSGVFFLADDAFRVGEYIDVGGTMGNVEKISLRSLRLRHHRGLVHTIPYGEIPKLTNFSRDWVIMKLRFRVPFETDINKVKKIFKKIGKEMLDHPDLGGDFLQPFKSQGVAEVDDNGIVVRGKFMAKPGKQFMIRKEVYVRVQKAFDEAGIPFARKQVMVHIPGLEKGDDISEEDLKSIGAAAAEAMEDPVTPTSDGKGKMS